MKNKICTICNKKFTQNSDVQKYCTQKCYKQAMKIYYIELHRKNYQKKIKKSVICPVCKEEFIQNSNSQKYCSKKCYEKVSLQKRCEQYKKRYRIDINYRLGLILRCRILGALKGINKSKSTMKLLGCSIAFFKDYYESKFIRGMSWTKVMNGEIHCDHIIPCTNFDLNKPEEQRKCFNYTNLQPLWAKENIIKSNN